jgi:nitrate/nitrite transporter NarK
VAVFNRTSLGVAGLMANHRFGISAAQLSFFTMLQLVVYAGMQIPVGLMVDRFGSRRVLMTGALLMTVAQTGFALATTYPEALVARTFVGAGDAMTFISVLRLVGRWFPLRRIALVTQLTGNVGQVGAIVAAIPLSWMLIHLGWTPAYLAAAFAGPVTIVGVLLFLRDAPQSRSLRGESLPLRALGANIRAAWAQPGTRLGFWVHFTTPFSSTVLALLWGYPFFVKGEGLSAGAAGSLLSLIVVANIVAGPILGWVVGRHPWHRSSAALVVVAGIVATWTIVLLWPGHAPYWLLAVLVLIVGSGGPASMIGFDVGRTSNPAHRLASASGIINVAGFVAALITIVAVGLILDWRTPSGGDYTGGAFHWAMSFQYVIWGLGTAMILRQRHRVRSRVSRDAVNSGDSMVQPSSH